MAFDLTGITNEREFYTANYLQEKLHEDLSATFARWTSEESPLRAVRRAGKLWNEMDAELEGLKETRARLECQRGWLRDLLTGLGYDWTLETREDEDGTLIPTAGEVARADGAPGLWLIEAVDPSNDLD